jgi:hypothetical protein
MRFPCAARQPTTRAWESTNRVKRPLANTRSFPIKAFPILRRTETATRKSKSCADQHLAGCIWTQIDPEGRGLHVGNRQRLSTIAIGLPAANSEISLQFLAWSQTSYRDDLPAIRPPRCGKCGISALKLWQKCHRRFPHFPSNLAIAQVFHSWRDVSVTFRAFGADDRRAPRIHRGGPS